ncbi:hypothetical protein FRB95_008193 [Tulasnella sp. JGI-2019a]|nr:hypothetical protein FRB95_008193 [Tulasnella sp. JGI-2019a]
MSQRVSTDEPTLVVSLPQGVEASRWEIEKNQKDVLIIGGDTAANINNLVTAYLSLVLVNEGSQIFLRLAQTLACELPYRLVERVSST